MQGAFTAAEIRAAEATLLHTRPDLMQRAAHALAVQCGRMLGSVYGARVTLLVGVGHNGGDTLFAGARLLEQGAQVRAIVTDPGRVHPAGWSAFTSAGGRATHAVEGDLVVDGLLGIGGRGGLRGPAVELARAARAYRTVAVDLPSGVDADTGAAAGEAVRAEVTVTFGALKIGLVVGAGADLCGQVRVADLGLRPHLPVPRVRVYEADDIVLRAPGPDDDKYTRGVVGVIAGSAAYPGAGVLATGSAVYGGAGLVRYLGSAVEQIRARYPEVVVHEGLRPADVRVQAWVIGPGIGTDEAASALVREVLATDVPVVVDADALTIVSRDLDLIRHRRASTILTPHDREFARVAGEVGTDRVGAARVAARDLGVTVLLKGNATVVADPDGSVVVNSTATPWLATAGSGDVLAGLIGSLLASGLSAAAATGAYLHGVAGQLAASDGPPSSADVLASVRPALAGFLR